MSAGPAASGRRHNATLAALATAGLSFALQQTLVIPALPVLQRDLHTSTAWVTWLLTAFLLAASVATPLLGKLGDQHGKERFLLIALAIFLIGSIGAALAPNIGVLIVCRALQGTSGAVYPLSFSIMKDELPAPKLAIGVGVISAVFAVGASLGMVVSGLIIDHTSWRWLFVAGMVPIVAAMALVHRFVPESPIRTRSRLDLPGATLLTAGLVCVLVAITEGESWGWSSLPILALFAVALLSLAAWTLVELRVPEPMVDMRMLVHRPVLFTNLTAALAGFSLFCSFVLIPNFTESPRGLPPELARLVDYGFGASVTMVGVYLLPGALTGLFTGPFAGLLGRRHGSQLPLALGMALAGLGLASIALWHDHPWQIVLGATLLGAGIPFTLAAMGKIIVDSVRPTETGVATAMNTVSRTVGGVVGGQVGAAILTAGVISGTSVPTESAFATAFWTGTVAALGAAVLSLLVTPPRWRQRGEPVSVGATGR